MNLMNAFAQIGQGFSAVFEGPFHDARVVEQAEIQYDEGGAIIGGGGPRYRTCRAQIDSATQRMREAEGFIVKDMAFIILAGTLEGALDTEAEIEVIDGPHAGRWAVSMIERDPVGAGWIGRGRRA